MNPIIQENSPILESSETSISLHGEKRGRGRPRKYPVKEESGEKRGRGRPRKYAIAQEPEIKRGRGRPAKYSIIEKEMLPSGEYKPRIKKVDSGHLLKQMFNYFTKLLVIHSELSKMGGKHEVVFQRLKALDFQMAEVCKTVLSREFIDSIVEEKEVA